MKSITLTLLLSSVLLSFARFAPALAADHPLAGAWKLEYAEAEVIGTGERTRLWGPKSEGLMVIGPDGHSFAVMVPEDPKAPLNANASTHRLTGESQTTIHRELAANPGPDQVRNFKLEGNKLTMATPTVKGADGRETRTFIHWIRLR